MDEQGEKSKIKSEKADKAAALKAEKAERTALIKAEKAERAAKQKAEKTFFEGVELKVRNSIEQKLAALMGGANFLEEPRNIQSLADGTGISRAAIRKYTICTNGGSEAAVPSAVALCKIADYFHVSPNYLLGYNEDGMDCALRKIDDAVNVTGLGRETVMMLSRLKDKAKSDESLALALRTLDTVAKSAATEILIREKN